MNKLNRDIRLFLLIKEFDLTHFEYGLRQNELIYFGHKINYTEYVSKYDDEKNPAVTVIIDGANDADRRPCFSLSINDKLPILEPKYSTDMILGNKMFRLRCDKNNCVGCELNIKSVLENEFPDINIKEIALAAEMHWEFGKLNIPGKSESEKIDIYLTNFKHACEKCGLVPTEMLLRLCMAVACADITAGTNRRLLPSINGIEPAKEKFIGKDPWVIFGMESKYLDYQDKVLNAYLN